MSRQGAKPGSGADGPGLGQRATGGSQAGSEQRRVSCLLIRDVEAVLSVPPFMVGAASVPLGPVSAARERLVYYRAMGMETPPLSDPEAVDEYIEQTLWWIRGGSTW